MRLIAILSLLIATGCKKDEPPTGEGVFAEGCPAEGGAMARQIGIDASLPGDVAVGTRGDFLLANEDVAVVITEQDKGSTYWYYGGVIADAVAMDGCAIVTEDKFDELPLIVGDLNFADVDQSVLRAFKGTEVEVLNDGADGEAAIVRVHGTDDTHWLVENELQSSAVGSGERRPISGPFGLDMTVDYILRPGSSVIEIETTYLNTGEDELDLLGAALLSYGPSMDRHAFSTSGLSIGGFSIDSGLPWIVASDGEGAYAYAPEEGNLGFMYFAGISVAVDLDSATFEPIELSPGEDDTRRSFFAIGPTGGGSATQHLLEVNPEPIRDTTYTLEWVEGDVLTPDGDPVAGARVRLEADVGDGPGVLDEVWTNSSGHYRMPVPVWDPDPWTYGLYVIAEGRDTTATVSITPTTGAQDLEVGPAGELSVAFTEDGDPVPARLELRRDDGLRATLWSPGEATQAIAPGSWSYTLTRGYEYAVQTGTVDIPNDGRATVTAELDRVVDTLGWMSIDTHVHSEHSPDSRVPSEDQLLHAAAHGLDIVLHTEHEHIVDQLGNDVAAGLGEHVNNLLGQEVTATMPEHMTMFPVTPDESFRGGFIPWYAKDIDEIYALMHERSNGGINILNHPGYMDRIDWNHVTAEPGLTDPTLLGWNADAAVWSWDFEGIEVMNGHSNPFADGGNRRFEHWQSLLNQGVSVVAAGCSDDHGGDQTGFARTYFKSPTDAPAEFEADYAVDAYKAGETMASTGAFARVDINGAGPGDLLTASGALNLNLHIEAISEIDVTHVVVFANCDQVARVDATAPDGIVKFSDAVSITLDSDTQVTVAAFGANRYPDGLPSFNPNSVPRVLTNPIWVDADGNGAFDAPGGRVCSYDVR
ncbi:MAG: CehA/McbA family metallohydrolase [Proteobacteria bacterium]|nr:CehA/McbA family metallohydrolase [Pseudomonadota bacterium]